MVILQVEMVVCNGRSKLVIFENGEDLKYSMEIKTIWFLGLRNLQKHKIPESFLFSFTDQYQIYEIFKRNGQYEIRII